MPRFTVAARVVVNDLPRFREELRTKANQVVRRTAFGVQAGAQERARVDTGAMANSFYVITSDKNTYSQAAGQVKGRNPKAELAPMAPAPKDDLHAVVASVVEYAIYNEYGTSRMSAQPMLTPAAEEWRKPFEQQMRAILK